MRKNGLSEGWTERRTDMMKVIVAFRNLAKAPAKDELGCVWTDVSGVPSRNWQYNCLEGLIKPRNVNQVMSVSKPTPLNKKQQY